MICSTRPKLTVNRGAGGFGWAAPQCLLPDVTFHINGHEYPHDQVPLQDRSLRDRAAPARFAARLRRAHGARTRLAKGMDGPLGGEKWRASSKEPTCGPPLRLTVLA